ncbi:MAG: glycosyl hydrolase, partial [Candidatus Omnitrophota bacterium]
MNKLIIPIIVAVILAAGIGAYFIFQKPAFPEPSIQPQQQPSAEKSIKTIKSREQNSKDSPFAANDFGIPSGVARVVGITTKEQMTREIEIQKIPYFKELGIKWARLHPNIFGTFGWSGVDPDHNGKNLDFSRQDALVKLAQENNIYLLAGISPLPTDKEWLIAQTYIPQDKEACSSYVKQLIERYDGDGKDDMPGLKYPIKYWQVENEPDLHNIVRRQRGNANFSNPEEYFAVLKLTYKAVKEADKDAKIMLNVVGIGQDKGNASVNYLKKLEELGAKDYYDIFSYHVYPDTYDISVLRDALQNFKQFTGNKPIWITESGITSKMLVGKFKDASERKQAAWVIKHYIFHRANGVEKIAWLSLTDMSPNIPEDIFKYSGLLTFKYSVPKLSYYTYKKMVEVLEGSDWDNIQKIQESGGIYIYKFNKSGKNIWVAWND